MLDTPLMQQRLESISNRAACLVAALGAVVLFGWAIGSETLQRISASFPPMAPNTALALLLAAIAILARARGERAATRVRLGGLAVLLIGLVTLAEFVWDTDLGINRMLSPLVRDPDAAGRMPLATAAALSLLGAALLLPDSTRFAALTESLAMAALLIGLLAGIGLVYGPQTFRGLTALSTIAIHSVAGLLLISFALLVSRPQRGFGAILADPGAGGTFARRALPIAIVVPLVLGWLRVEGQLHGYLDTQSGTTLFAFANVTVIGAAILLAAARAMQIERERASAVMALRESEARSRAILEQAATGIAEVSLDGRFVRANPGLCAITGYTADELSRIRFADITFPPDLDADLELLGRVLAGEIDNYTLEKRYVRKDGRLIWINLTASVVRRPCGEAEYFIAIVEDISRRKAAEAEIIRLNAELEHRVAERTREIQAANKELDAFSYSVSHDLKTPLRAIAGFTRIVLEEYADQIPAAATSYLERVRNGAHRMGLLVDDMLALSRLGRLPLEVRRVAVNPVVQRCLSELRELQLDRRVEFEIGELGQCDADPKLLEQIYINLLSNALKYTRGRDPACITVSGEQRDGEYIAAVRDNGVGFDMRYADKLFGVFQRLHRVEEFEGTGVGLAIVRRIVERHRGRVWAEAAPDRGAAFFFALPGTGAVDAGQQNREAAR